MFEYFYGEQADQFSFIRIPRILLKDDLFSSLSIQAKILYSVLLDRMSISMKNGWLDEENRAYIIYQISEIQKDLGFSKKKSMDYLTELEKFGLVEKKKRGFGLPSIIYVKSFLVQKNDARSVETGTSEGIIHGFRSIKMGTSGENTTGSRSVEMSTFEVSKSHLRGAENDTSEVPKSTPLMNYTNKSYTNKNYTKSNHILSSQVEDEMGCDDDMMFITYERVIKDNIEFDSLLISYSREKELLQGIVDMILETVVSESDSILIASERYPAALVKSRFLKLNYMHIEYIIKCFKENTTKVKNVKKYLLAALFNAPVTMDGYYRAEVNHDMSQFVG